MDDFFDDIDDLEEILDEQTEEAASDPFGNNTSQIGSVVYYDPVGFTFMSASSDGSSLIDANIISDWRTIMLGTVINEYEDKTVDVLMCGFLMAEPLRLPHMYLYEDKRKYIQNYVKDMFRRFVGAFFKQIPAYNELLKLDIDMPTVSDILHIRENFPQIFESLRVCSDLKKFSEYINRFRSNYIYVMHKNKMYMMRLSDEEEKPDIIIPDAIYRADFICVFRHIKLNESKTYEQLDTEVEKFIQDNNEPS